MRLNFKKTVFRGLDMTLKKKENVKIGLKKLRDKKVLELVLRVFQRNFCSSSSLKIAHKAASITNGEYTRLFIEKNNDKNCLERRNSRYSLSRITQKPKRKKIRGFNDQSLTKIILGQ